jgi:NAD(P)-dependent dehydrogenase (short-subunit alcohol dehydrogenase family)
VVVNLCMPHDAGAVGEIDLAEFRRALNASYGRAFLGVKYAILHLRAHGGGSLVNVTSADGKYGNPKAAAASATSGGLIVMTKSAALECAAKGDGVRVNGLLVGDIVRGKPKQGQVTVEDVAAAIAFMSADASNYLTGIVMPVDNGGMPL